MNYETTVMGHEDLAQSLEGADENAKRRKKWAIWAIVAVIGLMVALYLYAKTATEAAPADDSQVPVVTVVTAGRTTIAGTITANGSLAARRELPVGSVGEGGRVVSVPVDQGDWVRQGQVLVSIDRSVQNQQIEGARAQIGVAQADLNLAQANLDRASRLVERGFISKADIDRLTANRDAARARVGVARATLGELQARTARLNIYAPASGLVLTRSVEPGQTVGAGGQPLFTIAQGGEMELLAQVNEAQLAKLSPGNVAEVTPVGSDRKFSGQIWQVSPTVDPQTRQGTARIALSYDRALRPGGFATATINSGTIVAPLLPESAVLADGKGSYVYVIGKDNKAVRRSVETGTVTDQGIAIVGGLNGTERVVLRAGGFLTEGETVSPRLQKK
ncbi:Macrolide export protein MacA [Tsuneonella dongtanensis]|uniref:Macrolide export protein MacA n=1 Tax=Tsuneonella dongtanensis TaxID=692370 RepID=A0A1B2AAG4_9SPHN|nr:efflux RND transporter periplasmic adaptor subunit [Tsuneonella dongtanensis]ANY19173.1 Macrolide export protein MacA [Tsuneonella dongtanensis]